MTHEEALFYVTSVHDLKNRLSGLLLMADQFPGIPSSGPLKSRMKVEIRGMIDELEKRLISACFLGQSLTPNYRRTHLRVILDRVKDHQEVYAETKRIHLLVEGLTPDAAAEVDARLLEQSLRILVNNAIKFSPQGGEVALSIQVSPSHRAEIRVRDTGPGLSAEDRDRLFRPFHPLSSTATMGENSTGLGLTLAKKLMRIHGGRIWVEPAQERGSTFVLDMPMWVQ